VNRPSLRHLRKSPWLAAGAVVVLAGGLVAAGDSAQSATSQATVLRGNVTATAGAAGTVQSADTRELVFGTSGTVSEIKVAPGDKVRAGAVLARLDDSAAAEQVDVAKAAVAAADDTYDQAQQGICGGSGGSGGSAGGVAVVPAAYVSGPVGGRRATPSPTPSRRPTPTPSPTRTTPRPTPTSKPTTKRTPKPTSKPTSEPTATPTSKPTSKPTSPTPTPTPTRTSPKPSPTASRPTNAPTGRPKPSGPAGQAGGSGGRSGGSGGGAGGGGGGGGGGCQVNSVELTAASVTKAEVDERQAERTLAATRLTAPIDGTVLSVDGAVGGQVAGQSQTGFITLGDLNDLQVQAMFPLGEVNQLKISQEATIGLGMLAGPTYRGTVTRIDPAATMDGNRALFGVMISLDDAPPPGLRSGMSATVEVVTAQADSTLYVPAGAVHTKAGGLATVLVRDNGHTTVRTVRTGVRGDRYVAVTSGLTAGDHVVMPPGTGPDGFPTDTFPGT
jgi:multidrug efflux pump subunit AcrA (membrane-fusion protein)